MVEVICDTSFLIRLATARIKNISALDAEIGTISFVIPQVVINELRALSGDKSKQDQISLALEFAKKQKIIDIDGSYADKEILDHVRVHGGIVATLDKKLKSKIKESGGSILSLSDDRIVLES